MNGKSSIPLVSIYIVNYNYGRFLQKAVESVLNQTYVNLEIVIIDDGSSDNSSEVLETYRAIDNVKIFKQDNQGLISTIRNAVNICNGKYIIRLDADDWLNQHAISVMVDAIELDEKIALVYPDYYFVDEKDEITGARLRHQSSNKMLNDNPPHGACSLIRKSLINEVGGYSKDIDCQDGVDIWTKFIVAGYVCKNIDIPLFYYRQHGSNLTSNKIRIIKNRSKILAKNLTSKSVITAAFIICRDENADPLLHPLRKLADVTLLERTIDFISSSNKVSEIIFCTESSNLIKYAKKLIFKYPKLVIIKRPMELAQPSKSLNETQKFILSKIKPSNITNILQVSIEYPYRESTHIDALIEHGNFFNVDIVIPVITDENNYFLHNGNTLESLIPKREFKLKIEKEDVLREAGGLRLIKVNSFAKNYSDYQLGHILIDYWSAFKPKNEIDWELLENKINNQ